MRQSRRRPRSSARKRTIRSSSERRANPNVKLLRVVWLTPGFPGGEDDPNYVFLSREAAELADTGLVDLTILTEGLATHPRFDLRPLRAPSGLVGKVRLAIWGAQHRPSLLVRAVRDRDRWYPELWRTYVLHQELNQLRPDVVHSHFAYPEGTGAVSVSRSLGARTVVSLRGVDVLIDRALSYGFRLDPDYDRRLRECLAEADICLTATDRTRKVAIEAGAEPTRCHVLPNSYEPSSRDWKHKPEARLKILEGATIVLSVGHLINRKGFDLGVAALQHLPEHVHYVVLGGGADQDQLIEMALELGVDQRVHLVGQVSPIVVRQWMTIADCYWFLSRQEAFGNVVLEAFGAGLPIVATNRGAAPELLDRDAASRLLADPVDPVEVAALTCDLLEQSRTHELQTLDRIPKLGAYAPRQRALRLLDFYLR